MVGCGVVCVYVCVPLCVCDFPHPRRQAHSDRKSSTGRREEWGAAALTGVRFLWGDETVLSGIKELIS